MGLCGVGVRIVARRSEMVAGIARLTAIAAIGALLDGSTASAQSPDALRERAKNGVVMIRSQSVASPSSGAGVIIAVAGQDVYIVTAKHVVRSQSNTATTV